MIICVCGNGYSGSGAVLDYLKADDNIAATKYDFEFTFLYDVDGIDDLKHHIYERPVRFYSSDASIKRFLNYIKKINTPNSDIRKIYGNSIETITKKFIDNIVLVKWHGWWHYDVINSNFLVKNWNFRILTILNKFFSKLGLKEFDVYRNSKMYLSVSPNTFMSCSKEYISKLIAFINPNNKKYVLLNQPFPFGKMNYYKDYFSDEVKAINVVRDPRDIYIISKHIHPSLSSWIPTDNVDSFIKYYKVLNNIPKTDIDGQLTIKFEDLIYRTDETISKIDKYLGFKTKRNFKYFNPDISVNNTQLFKKYTQYENEMRIIEKELSDYIYDYSNITRTPKWDKTF